MRRLIFQAVLPLTFLSFIVVTKWWFGLAVDAKHVFFYGFPFIYKCEGFHTSLSTQYFIIPFLVNLLVYFSFWVIIIGLINRFRKVTVNKWLVGGFWVLYSVYLFGSLYLTFSLDDHYDWFRTFDVEIYETGIDIFMEEPKDIVPFLEKYS